MEVWKTFLLLFVALATARARYIASITYSYTTCGNENGKKLPTVTKCSDFYENEQADSLIFQDNQVGGFDENNFTGAQRFQVRKTGMYDITVAGAAGGRGLCSTEFGHGAVMKIRVQLEAGQEALILVGQKGLQPCDVNSQQLCQNPPMNKNQRNMCGNNWNNFSDGSDLVYNSQGGAAGGGASMVWLRQSNGFAEQPLVVGGGGGGTPSVFPDPSTFDLVRSLLESDNKTDTNIAFYQDYVNGKDFPFDEDTEGILGTTGRVFVIGGTPERPGVGGGWNNGGGMRLGFDGNALSSSMEFADGGRQCPRPNGSAIFFDKVNGGFGGGGGACRGGGGGGGYTGGTAFSGIGFAGSGGYSYVDGSVELLSSSMDNAGSGYVHIMPAECGCTGSCVITGEKFKCTCPEEATLAPDENDCYKSTNIDVVEAFDGLPIEFEEYEAVFVNGYSFLHPVVLYSAEVDLDINLDTSEALEGTEEEDHKCVLLFVGKDLSVALASSIIMESGMSSVELAEVTVTEEDEVIVSDYVDILENGIDGIVGVITMSHEECLIEGLLANISIRKTSPSGPMNMEAVINLQTINPDVLFSLVDEVFQPNEAVTDPPTITMGNGGIDVNQIIISIAVSAAVFVVLASVVVVAFIVCRKRRNAKNQEMLKVVVEDPRRASEARYVKNMTTHNLSQPPRRGSPVSNTASEAFSLADGIDELLFTESQREFYKKKFSDVLVAYADLAVEEKAIGEGAFGKVYRGKLERPDAKGSEVAVKTIKYATNRELEAFFEETFLMKNFSHPNIVGLLGVCLDSEDGFPYIIMSFMSNGNLKEFLKRNRIHFTDINTFPKDLPLPVMLEMCINIAEGMKYLAANKFVHRDLAARNCMVDKDLKVKVGDFGLARDIYSEDYYRARRGAKLPVKWMPPETLRDGISNEKTDVWSFGVTCWELFSLGSSPYAGIENSQLLEHLTSDEQRLQKPKLCPEDFFPVVQRCWSILPEERPTFGTLVILLQDYRDEQELYI